MVLIVALALAVMGCSVVVKDSVKAGFTGGWQAVSGARCETRCEVDPGRPTRMVGARATGVNRQSERFQTPSGSLVLFFTSSITA